jgi:phage gpG-like protein
MDFTNSIQEWATHLNEVPVEDLKTSYLIGSSSHKIELSNQTQGGKFLSAILYLLQENLSGVQMCPWATDSCREVCLGTNSGHAAMVEKGSQTNVVQVARLKRTLLFANHRETFLKSLRKELDSMVKKAFKKGVHPAFRFNGTSDFPFEVLGIMEEYQAIQFYDYTKSKNRMMKFLQGKMPRNYHLTFSYTPENEDDAREVLAAGGNVAVVFNEKTKKIKKVRQIPSFVGKSFLGNEVIDGDIHDLRFDDPQGGYVVGLTRKGNQKDMAFFQDLDKVLETV